AAPRRGGRLPRRRLSERRFRGSKNLVSHPQSGGTDMTPWKVTVDRDRCIGSGMCLVYAPGTFTHDDAAKAVVIDGSTDDLDTVRVAVEACPTRALALDEGGA